LEAREKRETHPKRESTVPYGGVPSREEGCQVERKEFGEKDSGYPGKGKFEEVGKLTLAILGKDPVENREGRIVSWRDTLMKSLIYGYWREGAIRFAIKG